MLPATPMRRRSIRLPLYDYSSPGLYFVTVCTAERAPLFGRVEVDVVRLSPAGHIARDEWERTSVLRPDVELDTFVVMPDHVHLLFGIVAPGPSACNAKCRCRGTARCAPTGTPPCAGTPSGIRRFGTMAPASVPSVVRAYKSAVTRAINEARGTPAAEMWQRGYHERVVRSEREAARIRCYIAENPARSLLAR